MVKVMAINAGSSSLKFQLINMPSEEVITSGIVERIGLEEGNFEMKYNGEKFTKQCPISDHSVAVQLLLDALVDHHVVENLHEIEACGHRIVHGGEYFNDSIKVDEDVVAKVEELAELAPLHNPAHIIGYNAFKNALPGVEHVFVFDTAFHQTLDQERYLYPLPMEYYKDLKVRKYGAHGTSHKYVSQVANEMLGKPENSKIIVCHLGNGASISAVQDGVCIDTSMGFTPLAGVMMGTRCGDVDPSAILYMMEKENLTLAQMNHILNKESGLLGVSGRSSDMRDIDKGIAADEHQSLLAQKLYCTRVAQFIGSYFVELGGCDALVFTAGVGENSKSTRSRLLPMISEALGIEVDESQTIDVKHGQLISTKNSKVKVYIIPTNEELMIARDTYELVQQNG